MKRTPSIIPEWRWEALIRAYTTLRGVPTPPPVRRSSSTTLQAQGDSLSHRPSECHICRRRRLPVPSGYPHRHPTPYTQRPTPQSSDGPRGGNRGRSRRISPVTHAITVKRVSHHRLFRARPRAPQDRSTRRLSPLQTPPSTTFPPAPLQPARRRMGGGGGVLLHIGPSRYTHGGLRWQDRILRVYLQHIYDISSCHQSCVCARANNGTHHHSRNGTALTPRHGTSL